jgi:prepilin-type N-terminal cleavage/methylation domain-containing protein
MDQKRFRRRAKRRTVFGFSLLELSIAILITGIVAAVVIPKYTSSLNRYQTQVAAQRLSQDIELCRRQARFTSQNITLTISYSQNFYSISHLDSPLRPGSPYEVTLGESSNSPSLCPVSNGQIIAESQTNPPDLTIIFDRYGVPSQRAEIGIRCGAVWSIIQLSAEGVVTRS